MSSVVHLPDELRRRLEAAAAERGVSSDDLASELIADRLPAIKPGSHNALEAFIGSGASGRTEAFDIHRARAEAAAAKLGQGA